MKLVYIAGPLHNPAERAYLEKIDKIVRKQGFASYLPHRDGGLQTAENHREVYRSDMHHLAAADLVVAWLDGADVDSGTAFEVGWAIAREKPVIGIREDQRSYESECSVNSMIWHSVTILENLRFLEGQLGFHNGTRIP